MKLSIVVPCYNEEQNIQNTFQELVKVLKQVKCSYEITFVDNGGTDSQLSIMKKIYQKNKNIMQIVSLARNFGYQASILAGLKHSTGDALVTIDADLQDPPEMILEFISKWEQGYDVVYGIREKRKDNLFRRATYKLFYRIFNMVSDVNIPLDAGDFALINKKVQQHIIHMNEKVFSIRGIRSWVGFQQIGIPYTRRKRELGKTKFNFISNYILALDNIFSFSTRLLSYLSLIGLFFILVAIGLAFYVFILKFYYRLDIPGYPSILTAICFFGGIQLLFLGLLGSLLERVFLETKQRPHYIVQEYLKSK